MALPLPYPASARRGVTLLELLVVLTLMGVASALVVPALARRALQADGADVTIVVAARRTAIGRAEPLRLRLFADGAWTLTAQRDGAVVDSGHVRDSLPAEDLLLDALGGCVPSPRGPARAFDPMACAFVDEAARP